MESAIFTFALLNADSDRMLIERALKLALRGPDPLRDQLRTWLESHGQDVDLLMSEEPPIPASEAEVKELIGPVLNRATDMASLAQIADIYLFREDLTPENILYAFYNGTRFRIAGEREPTNKETKRIWAIALWLTQTSKIGEPHWKELESQGPVYLKSWLETVKENARKRYETFLIRKKRADLTAENSRKTLMSIIFGDEENP